MVYLRRNQNLTDLIADNHERLLKKQFDYGCYIFLVYFLYFLTIIISIFDCSINTKSKAFDQIFFIFCFINYIGDDLKMFSMVNTFQKKLYKHTSTASLGLPSRIADIYKINEFVEFAIVKNRIN